MVETLEIEAQNLNKVTYDLQVGYMDSNSQYDTFFHMYMNTNVPCIIKNIGIDWNASKFWVKKNKPNFAHLLEKYGQSMVTIYDCNKRYYNSQKTQPSLLRDCINNWSEMKEKLYYIKDWHLQNEFPDDNFYYVPIYFASDWLNEYLCENSEDDYRFVYMGPTGTWTPFHVDVFTSYSWSINICGQKKWILLAPGEENKLRDGLGNLPYELTNISLENCKYFEIVQNANEAIFVPSGWHHQVWNMKDTLSINHNWVNGCNIRNMWQSLEDNLIDVEKEISDCRDMDNFDEHCQVMLKASYGLDFTKFYQFLKYIAVKRINLLESNIKTLSFGKYNLGRMHCIFDLKSIKDVLQLFINNPASKCLKVTDDCPSPKSFLYKINQCLDNIIQ